MAADQGVKLLGGWFSPFVFRVEVALKLKGIEYELLEEDLTNKSPLLLESNPLYKKVPVLIHHGKPICESFVILEYIDETWKNNPLMPHDPYAQAVARFWAKFVEEKFTEVVRRILTTEGEQQEKEVKRAQEALEILEGEIKGKKFFGGDNTMGFVDLVLVWSPVWLGVVEETAGVKIHDPEKHPHLDIWMHNLLGLAVIKESMPPRDKLVQYFEKVRQYALSAAAGN